MADGVSQSATAAGPSGVEKGMEKLLRGVWYSFYGESPKLTGPRDGQAVLQLHLALDLLNTGPVRAAV